jgi:hypothetical protein
MFDVSHRFLNQLAVDRRASLHRSGEASENRRRPLRAALVRLGLRPDLPAVRGTLRRGAPESTPDATAAVTVTVALPAASDPTTRLRNGAQQT